MSNRELFTKMQEAIISYDKDESVRLANLVLEKDINPTDAIVNGFSKGIQIVGDKFEREEIFLPELVMGADAMAAASSILEEAIRKSGKKTKSQGKGIAGTVRRDLHDIGIRLVTSLLVANGFDIEFLGYDIPTSLFIEKIKELKPDFILLSALLTTTMPNQEEVILELEEAGIRDKVKVIVGGSPVTRDWAEKIGADGYGENAASAVRIVKEVLN